jgi:hypothetical protein
MTKNAFIYFLFLAVIFTSSMEARQPYRARATVSGESVLVTDPNIRSLMQDLKSASLSELLPIYTPTSAISINLNLRGIGVITAFAANSTILTLDIPQIGISTSFTGSTRDDSVTLMQEFLKSSANDNPNFFKAFARYSPIDPIAGNPNSLMAAMAQGDYLFGNLSPLSGCNCCWSAQPITHQFQTGLNVGRGLVKGFETTTINIPLRYSYSPNRTYAFIIDLPNTLNKYDGAYSLAGSLGFGLRIPITHEWSITPTLRGGLGGSVDLIGTGTFVSTGLVSNYNFAFYHHVLSITNQASYFTSTPFHLGSINCDYHLHNFVFKNGFALTFCQGVEFCCRTYNYKVTFIDSAFAGDHLYIEHYDEVGISLVTHSINPCIDYDCLIFGFAYQFGQRNYKGYSVNFVYQF